MFSEATIVHSLVSIWSVHLTKGGVDALLVTGKRKSHAGPQPWSVLLGNQRLSA